MVDDARVHRLLARVAANVGYLGERARRDRAALRREPELSALKYRFVVALEGCIDVAQHLCASEGWGAPATNADAMRILGYSGVLGSGLALAMADAVGFRNVLVRQYADVDDDLVVGTHLDRVGDLEAFVAAVSAWVERQVGTG